MKLSTLFLQLKASPFTLDQNFLVQDGVLPFMETINNPAI